MIFHLYVCTLTFKIFILNISRLDLKRFSYHVYSKRIRGVAKYELRSMKQAQAYNYFDKILADTKTCVSFKKLSKLLSFQILFPHKKALQHGNRFFTYLFCNYHACPVGTDGREMI